MAPPGGRAPGSKGIGYGLQGAGSLTIVRIIPPLRQMRRN
ncbi:MAG: hypothetical protein A4E36_01422 [Methanoregulaceae archaeon PtaB.Bin009]|nr:MAG: hypothetical protein A4E36_01422 [Methanoregulaceae archaeon PtaB.Bin009]OPY40934.1 MAG: hypothetical protein A4E41_01141 [Methanoregulaceae archaeon PtaU1.Bin066]